MQPKAGRGNGEVRFSLGAQNQSIGTLVSEAQAKRGQQERPPRGEQVPSSQTACGYCGKGNHSEENCWVKGRKCLFCRSSKHLIGSCPTKLPRNTNTLPPAPRQANDRGN